MHEHRLDVEELGRDLEIELLHEDEVLVILPADVDERQVANVELVLPDQVQQQVERPLELRQLHRVGPHEVRAGGDGDADAFSQSSQAALIASETLSIVSEAISLALALPVSSTSFTKSSSP